MIRLRFAALAAALALTGSRAVAAQELVANGGFETVSGDATFPNWPSADWTLNSCFGGLGKNHKYTGSYGVYLSNGCTFSQVLGTTSGQDYTFSLWVRRVAGQTLSAEWNGVTVSFDGDTAAAAFVQLSAVVTAEGTQSTIAFFSTITEGQFLSIDDISVQRLAETPPESGTTVSEPSTVALTAVGLVLLGGAARRRRQRA